MMCSTNNIVTSMALCDTGGMLVATVGYVEGAYRFQLWLTPRCSLLIVVHVAAVSSLATLSRHSLKV